MDTLTICYGRQTMSFYLDQLEAGESITVPWLQQQQQQQHRKVPSSLRSPPYIVGYRHEHHVQQPDRSPLNELQKVRLLVLGDGGVGKSMLLQRICEQRKNAKPISTVGANIEVMIRKVCSKSLQNQLMVIEWLEIGGHRKFRETGSLFFTQCNGIMLMFDCNNSASYRNLKYWIKALVAANETRTIEEGPLAQTGLQNLPLFIVGSKMDLVGADAETLGQIYPIQADYGTDGCFASSTCSCNFTPIMNFVDKVCERRHGKLSQLHHSPKSNGSKTDQNSFTDSRVLRTAQNQFSPASSSHPVSKMYPVMSMQELEMLNVHNVPASR